MTDEPTIEIRDYSDELAKPLAEMYNSWESLWPDGFTQGVPFTAERVIKQYQSMRALAILIAIDKQTSKPIGSVTLLSHWRDPEAAYVGTLGVTPDALNKKVGKRLLMKCFEIALHKGYARVDLSTWAGNLRAVPLYKKMGLMWNPEGQGVQMESYVPGILRHPLCAPFFATNPDPAAWYTLQRRDVAQAPDDTTEHGMAVYVYNFESGKNNLHVLVDRLARSITGIERVMHDERLVVKAQVSQHMTLCGIPSVYELRIENGTARDMDFAAALEGLPGLHFDGVSEARTRVKAKKSFTLAVPFSLSPDAPLYRRNIKTPSVVAKLRLNGQESILRTGLRIKPVVDIQTKWKECRVLPSGTVTIPITLVNNSTMTLKGKLMFEEVGPHISMTPPESEFELAPEGLGGAVITVTTQPDLPAGTHDLWAYMIISYLDEAGKRREVKTGRSRISLFCLQGGRVTAGEDDRTREVLLVAPQYTARILREGAILRLSTLYGSSITQMALSTEIGPPFGLSPFRFTERDVRVRETESGLVVSATATHPERPLVIEDRWVALNSSPVLKHEVWVTNTGQESHEMQVRLNGREGGIPLNFDRVFVPLPAGVVEAPTGNLLMSYPSIPSELGSLTEEWVATGGPSGASGQVWKATNLESVYLAAGQLSRIVSKPLRLKGKETKCISEVWNIAAASDWRDIQRIWKANVKGEFENIQKAGMRRPTLPMIAVSKKTVIIPHRQSAEAELTVENTVSAPVIGNVEVESPEGWDADIRRLGGSALTAEQGTDESKETVIQGLQKYILTLKPTDLRKVGFSVERGLVRVRTPMEFREYFTLLQLGSAGSAVTVTEGMEQGIRVFRVNNGVAEFAVSADYGGCLFSLKNSHSTELLCSSFPKPAPKLFMDNYYGGVQPLVWDDSSGEDFFQVKTNREKMDVRPCEHGGVWKGVEVSWTSQIQQTIRGVQYRLQYLAAPESPMVLVNWVIKNPTEAPLFFIPCLFADPGFNGVFGGSIVHTRWGGSEVDLRNVPVPAAVTPETNSLWLRRSGTQESNEGLGILWAGLDPGSIAVCTNEMAACISMDFRCWLMPGDERVVRACLFVNPPNFEALEKVQATLTELF